MSSIRSRVHHQASNVGFACLTLWVAYSIGAGHATRLAEYFGEPGQNTYLMLATGAVFAWVVPYVLFRVAASIHQRFQPD